MLKTVFLLLALALLTWYGKQKSNNPFAPVSEILISGNRENLSLFLYQRSRKNLNLVVIAMNAVPVLWSGKYTFPRGWNLVSGTADGIDSSFLPHPETWHTIATPTGNTGFSGYWPPPRQLTDTAIGPVTFERIYPFNDERPALSIIFSGSSLLLINRDDCPVTDADRTKLMETSDVLIITGADTVSAALYRSIFRPRYTVTTAAPDTDLKTYANLFRFGSSEMEQLVFKSGETGVTLSDSTIFLKNQGKVK